MACVIHEISRLSKPEAARYPTLTTTMIVGSTPAVAMPNKRASGLTTRSAAVSRLIKTTAASWLTPEAFPTGSCRP